MSEVRRRRYWVIESSYQAEQGKRHLNVSLSGRSSKPKVNRKPEPKGYPNNISWVRVVAAEPSAGVTWWLAHNREPRRLSTTLTWPTGHFTFSWDYVFLRTGSSHVTRGGVRRVRKYPVTLSRKLSTMCNTRTQLLPLTVHVNVFMGNRWNLRSVITTCLHMNKIFLQLP